MMSENPSENMSWSFAGNSSGVSGMADNNSNVAVEAMSDPSCLLFKLGLYGVAMGLLCAVGLVGNTISILVLQKDRSTPVASFLLESLAVADNIFLALWLVHNSVKSLLHYLGHSASAWIYVRVYTFPVLYIAQTQTIWLTVVIALNRFMAVCMPYRAPHLCNIHNVYKEVSVVTLFSIAYNIPRFFELEVMEGINGTEWNRTAIGMNNIFRIVYTDALYYIFSFILPLLILAFVNTRVIIVYNATRQRRQRMTSSIRRNADSENNITLVMIMIVVIFMICQAPARIVQIVWSYKYNHCNEIRFYLIHISNTLEVLNSSINFLIYFVFHKRFRNIMANHFCCCTLPGSQRNQSARFTTTEGLSLEEVQRTTPACSDKKSSSQEHNRNGSIHFDKSTAITMTDGVLDGDLDGETDVVVESVKEPLNHPSNHGDTPTNTRKVNIADNTTEPQDDASQPLAP